MTLIQTGVRLFALHFGICLMRFGAQSARTQYVVVVLLFMVANDSFKVITTFSLIYRRGDPFLVV